MTVLAGIIGAIIGIIAYEATQHLLDSRKPKPSPYYAQLALAPGKSVLDLVDGERVLVSLVLRRVDRRFGAPSTAEFVDKTYYIERNTYRD